MEKRGHIVSHSFVVLTRNAIDSGGINDGEVQLFLGSAQGIEKIKYLINHPIRAGARPVDLVHHHDGIQTSFKGFGCDEAGLRHRPIDSVDQQQHRVDHRQDSLNFTAKVSVPRGIDDIDAIVVPRDRSVLREDRDPAFALLIVRIHDPLCARVLPVQCAGLLEQAIDQRSFSMVNVGNDGDIAKGFHVMSGKYRGARRLAGAECTPRNRYRFNATICLPDRH